MAVLRKLQRLYAPPAPIIYTLSRYRDVHGMSEVARRSQRKKLSSAKRTHGATGIADCFFSFFFLFVADFLQFAPQAMLVKKALS